jgi:hypothetical protein
MKGFLQGGTNHRNPFKWMLHSQGTRVAIKRRIRRIERTTKSWRVKEGGPRCYVTSMLRGQKGQQGGLQRGETAFDGNLCILTTTGIGLLPPTALFSNSNRR